MRRNAAGIVAIGFASVFPACSLLVSTDGLSGEPPAAPLQDATTERVEDAPDASPRLEASIEANDAPDAPPPDPNLVGAWSFDETTGTTAKDSSGKGHSAILVGAAAFAPSIGADGGGAVVLTGGHIRVAGLEGAAFPRTGTLSVWFRWKSMSVDVNVGLFDNYDPERPHLFLRHANGSAIGEFQYALQVAGGGYPYAVELAIAGETWTHLVVTWNEATRRVSLHMNGVIVEEAQYPAPAFAPTSQVLRIGERLDGAIDDLCLYDRAMSPSEAAALRCAP